MLLSHKLSHLVALKTHHKLQEPEVISFKCFWLGFLTVGDTKYSINHNMKQGKIFEICLVRINEKLFQEALKKI